MRQFNLMVGSSLLMLTAACDDRPASGAPEDHFTQSVSTDSHIGVVQYGYVGERVEYVAITMVRKPASVRGIVDVTGIARAGKKGMKYEVRFRRPDGRKEELRGSGILLESIDGNFRESTARLLLPQLMAFLDSDPAEYSINSLQDYLCAKKR